MLSLMQQRQLTPTRLTPTRLTPTGLTPTRLYPKHLLFHIVLRLPAVVMAFPGGLQTTVEVIRSVASDFST